MDLFDTLASIGLTTRVLQIIILASIAVFLIGLFWRFIVIGTGILFCIFVFVMPAKSISLTESVNTPEVTEMSEADVAPPEFIQDCIRLNKNATKSSCEKMWKEDGNGNN